ncbi:MAG: GNAT family N-acetyltransferase [Desulfosalsimonas sp.]
MPAEIRPASVDEMGTFRQVAKRALIMPSSVAPAWAIDSIKPEWTLCAFEDGQLATSYAWWPLNMRLNGRSSPVAGITYVGTHPAYRRKGHLRDIVSRHFEKMYEEGGMPIAALHASRASIYKRFGYAVVSLQNSYSVAPERLVFCGAGGEHSSPDRLKEPADGGREVIKDIYRRFCADRTGCIHRARPAWDAGALCPPPKDGALFRMVCDCSGAPEGYVIYTVKPEKGTDFRLNHRVVIRDIAWLSPAAYFSIWRHLSMMDTAGSIDWIRVPSDDPLPDLVCEPGDLNIKTRDGLMARIVDAAGALGSRGYDSDGSACFELEDEICPWNRGRWLLDAEGGIAQAVRTEKKPEAGLSVQALAMLVFGRISATGAARTGLLNVFEPEALAAWDRLFATRHAAFCPDFF